MSAKTLDQYTPEERAQMIGMWCDHDDKGRMKQSIIASIVHVRGDDGCMRQSAVLYWPEQKHWHFYGEELATVTPRFDLLRAWTPAGKPVPSQAEWSTVDRSTSPANQWKGLRFSAGSEEYARTSAHSFGYDVERRFVTDWEEQA